MNVIKPSILSREKSKIKTTYSGLNIAIVGPPKIGKTTFASKLGDQVYFAATEKGHDFVEIFKSEIGTWKDFEDLVNALTNEAHEYKHLVIDIFDRIHELAQREICARNKVKEIGDMPFGAGYSASKRLLIGELERINKIGIGITFITHAMEKEIKKDSITWTAVTTSMSKSIEEKILGMCDIILFCYMDKNGNRMARTKPTKYIQCAGDRSGKLPETMLLDPKLVMALLYKQKELV